jgi:hypothetical protein
LAHRYVSLFRKIELKRVASVKKLIITGRKRYTSNMNNLLKKTLLPLIILGLLTFLGLQLNNKKDRA